MKIERRKIEAELGFLQRELQDALDILKKVSQGITALNQTLRDLEIDQLEAK